MFVVINVVDAIRIPAHNFRLPTLVALQNEIDVKYPNRVLMDVGLVICRYGDILKITNGSCVPGDGGCHHECIFRLVVFRPFVEEVCVGKIVKSTSDGVQVSLGFFQNIFIPAYWMLRPSQYDEKVGLWVWTPDYGDDEDGEDGDDNNNEATNTSTEHPVTTTSSDTTLVAIQAEEGSMATNNNSNGTAIKKENDATEEEEDEQATAGGDRWEMEIGAEIRFKVKSIQFTQVTNTAKGVQATTTTTDHSHAFPTSEQEEPATSVADQQQQQQQQQNQQAQRLRKRSTSFDLSESQNIPGAMQIIASICEDGLGLTSWWTSADEDDEEEDDEGDDGMEGAGEDYEAEEQ